MIKLTRLDGQAFILNADLIRYVEERPDTFVTLVSGERIVVNEAMDQVVELAIDYQQRKAMLPSLMRAASRIGPSGNLIRNEARSENHASASSCNASTAE